MVLRANMASTMSSLEFNNLNGNVLPSLCSDKRLRSDGDRTREHKGRHEPTSGLNKCASYKRCERPPIEPTTFLGTDSSQAASVLAGAMTAASAQPQLDETFAANRPHAMRPTAM